MRMLVVVLFLLCCCAPEGVPPLRGTISSELGPECIGIILEADAWWAKKLGKDHIMSYVEVSNVPQPDYREVTFVLWNSEQHSGYALYNLDGAKRTYNGRIKLEKNCSLKTAAHEIGHVLGLAHHKDEPESLMCTGNCPNWNDNNMELTDTELSIATAALGE